ncbi:indolepyruvate ferredoxin oxidoreductase subunit alpha [Lachnospiraceae bacterium 42-17]|jgi:indolepyruvate ferredoxin oxidoreductase alpha subunit|nr:indolepyruvate ferredoxin oxidoreductase subunit alpha [Dorea sp.]
MHKEFLMGNEAIALGAIAAGVNLVSGYPGTPSSEVLETVAKRKRANIYVEWSVNEKSAIEVAAGAAYTGARSMVTMKQVGLNVASDPLMSLEYIGVKGGMVILVADDPGPISSQTEQDTRHYAAFSKLPCFDPSDPQEAYEMVQEAFEYSEKYETPVFLRPTTRVCHGYASITIKDETEYRVHNFEGFRKDSGRWVIFPRLSYQNHIKIEARNKTLADDFSRYSRNRIYPACEKNTALKKGVASGGISFAYAIETLEELGMTKLLKISTPHPFPEKLALSFLDGLTEVLCIEELDPIIERELTYICGKYHLPVKICGKLTGHVKNAGENSRDSVQEIIMQFLEIPSGSTDDASCADAPPALPVRPPVLCAGCPHRASFYAVKSAMKGRKTIFCGDIGCYTLGNAMPLDMVDTCLCMGAGLGIAQGVGHMEPDTACFAFVGDSTFFASAITGVINAVYNQADMTLVILDNSTTAMTGHQPHPGTGRTMMGGAVQKINIEAVLRGIGLSIVETVNPLDYAASVENVKRVADEPGVKAIIFKSPCIALTKPSGSMTVNSDKCINCRKCIHKLGCPALMISETHVSIDTSLCTGCSLCAQLCPVNAICPPEVNYKGGVHNE